jgi:hypothetical protein
MKKIYVLLVLCVLLSVTPTGKAEAQIPIWDVIKGEITKVIKAVDLEIQRLQNNAIWLQNAQKAVENTMTQLHLNDITSWVQKQKDLYSQYFKELWEVKTLITTYGRIKSIATVQGHIVSAYKMAWRTIQQDKHFTADEISYMGSVYTGILNQTVDNISQLLVVVNSFATEMSDAKRLEIINHVGDKVDESYADLQRFNTENGMLSLQRARDANDAAVVKWMYGLQ